MIPCISQVCTLPSTFAEDIRAYSDSGCKSVEVWLTKLEKHLETTSVAETQALLADREVALVAASYQGGLLLSQGDARRASFDHFKRRLDLCQTFGIRTLVVAPDFATAIDQTSLGRAVVSLAEAARWAAGFGVTLAVEFRGTDAFCTNLNTALLVIDECGEPNVGVCLDAFHYYKGPSKAEDLSRLVAGRIAHVHLCDVPGVPRELMTDSDRVFPGEGDFDLTALVAALQRLDYRGAVSLELMNPTLWKVKPTQLVELGLTALTHILAGG